MEDSNVLAAMEAVLFACGDPLGLDRLAELFQVTELQLNHWLDMLETSFEDRGIQLLRQNDTVQLAARRQYNTYIESLNHDSRPGRLSAPTLETLAIIAYRQPITRPEIEEIRGVKVEKALYTLLTYDMITEVGRRETTGRPILYGTTEEFLRHFGIENLEELPVLD